MTSHLNSHRTTDASCIAAGGIQAQELTELEDFIENPGNVLSKSINTSIG